MKNKLLVFIISLGIVTGLSLGLIFTHSHKAKKEVQGTQTFVQRQLANEAPTITPGIPVTIAIPKIKVNAVVESVGMDPHGRMDIPKKADETAWFSPGYKPGMHGSAVIDGHLDKVTGAPAVFWNLKLLTTGDSIIVTEDNGKSYTFAVDRIMRYPYNSFPIKEVFGATNVPMLNLITCNGTWDKQSKNYSDRLVVYSKLVSQN